MFRSNVLNNLYIFLRSAHESVDLFIFSEEAVASKTTYFTKVIVDKVALSLYQSLTKNSSVDNR